ncbi:type I glyceraldehyde-3-phosphate dehydrogenase [Hominifimenecus microfluidus]|uniref:type I glyceraldehyde-3-phosphate dehydrogenase n=1 Tax=Hominifimenecus microfluidus TaxID=2885348 RepID=UPI0032C1ECFB
MAIKVGINGFGRIGRVVFRLLMERADEFELCGINLRNADIPHMVYMVRYDSIHGRFPGTIEEGENSVIVNGKAISVFSETDPAQIPWASCGAEYIIESTGAFNTVEKSSGHLKGGAKKVVITAPSKDKVMPTYVMGVNHTEYKPEYDVVSNASCTTNCLAPLVKVVNDAFGIEEGLMSTIHSATAKQKAVDARAGRDWRTGRSVFNNIIPSTTGAAKACGLVIPEMQGKLTGMSFRVPSNDVSIVDLTVRLKTPTTYEEICKKVKEASEGSMKGIISYVKDEVVSSDLKGITDTCIFDESSGIMLNDHFVKLLAWYDNEWGYSSKVLDLVKHVHDTCEGC